MSTFLLAWELGAGYGHVAPLRELALRLHERGQRCVFALRDLDTAEELLAPELGPVLQAPLAINAPLAPVSQQISYASLLNNVGYDDPVGLAGRIRAWRELIRASGCSLVYADHAPTALIAAHSLGLPAVALGSGFMLPPLADPYPAWDTAAPPPAALVAANQAAVLANLNAALSRLGLAPLPSLQAIFHGVDRALLTCAELDHYGERPGEHYRGWLDSAAGDRPVWAPGTAPRLLAYLRPQPMLPALLRVLQRSSAQVLVRIAGAAAEPFAGYTRPGLVITDRSVDLQAAAESCDAYIGYAAHGMVFEMLLAGRPGLLLPDTVERALLARRVLALGAGLVPADGSEASLAAALDLLLHDPALRAAAAGFAQRYRGLDRAAIMAGVADLGISRVRGGSAAA